MEKEKVYTLVTIHCETNVGIDVVSTDIYKEMEIAILDAKSNAEADFYIGGDREKSSFFEYTENDHLTICNLVSEQRQVYGNQIIRPHTHTTTWRLVFQKEIK
jgi:hypothetical protein